MVQQQFSRESVTDFLAAVVHEKGHGAEPRPTQVDLTGDIMEALQARTTFSGVAPPGTGKSFAYLSCAALLATGGERTLVSTEMIGLQHQLLTEDLPLVAAAARHHLGYDLKFAGYTGAHNYVDPVQLCHLADQLIMPASVARFDRAYTLDHLESLRDQLVENHDRKFTPSGKFADMKFSSTEVLVKLVLWGLNAYLHGGSGAKSDVPVTLSGDDWSLISAVSDERAKDKTLKGFLHKYDAARLAAKNADIVVVNHSLLGIEANLRGVIIMESKMTGHFTHVIVDEAHALPSKIRDQGSAKLSASSFRDVGQQLIKVSADTELGKELIRYGEALGKVVAAAVNAVPAGWNGAKELVILPSQKGPFTEGFMATGETLFADADKRLAAANKGLEEGSEAGTALNKVRGRLSALWQTLQIVQRPQDERADNFVARCANVTDGKAVIEYKLIPVDALSRESLWDSGDTLRGVACVSATLSPSFGSEMDVVAPKFYASPFTEAMTGSAFYVAPCGNPRAGGLLTDRGGFSTKAHPAWAVKHMIELVKANDGRALVLSANGAGAKFYAQELQTALAGTGITVLTPGFDRERAVASFRRDERSVLVGTRGLMTGLDVKGESLSLVVIDRPSRSAGNVVDDARVARIMQMQGINEFEATAQVYVAEAAMLLDQAGGRLIRHGSDRGLVAVLDPRLNDHWNGYSGDKGTYLRSFAEFGQQFQDLGSALTWLQERRTTVVRRDARIAELEAQLALGS